jgi:hypothetical protein
MLFITDQHHLGDLEGIVNQYGRHKTIRLLGDVSPNQENVGAEREVEEGSSLLKRCQMAFKHLKGMSRYQELTFEQKKEAHEQGIRSADEGLFSEFVAYYGAGPIFNLVRKHYVNYFVRSKVICLHGNEGLLDHTQQIVYERIAAEQGLPNRDVMKHIVDFLRERKGNVFELLAEHLGDCGIQNAREFVLNHLQVSNYGRRLPTSLTVFKGHPERKRFSFRESICWERKDNAVLIYVPYFNDEAECYAALAQVRELEKFVGKAEQKHVLIGYHGNPFPNLMDDKRLHARVDHNLPVIQAVVDAVTRAKGEQQEIRILCGHLHRSNPEYHWPGRENILIYPMGTQEIVHFNTQTGNIKKEDV